MRGNTPAVEGDAICRRYGRRWALVDVTFTVPTGAVFVVVGRNGSGKSTLLRVLSTAIRADRGTARMAGHDVRYPGSLLMNVVDICGIQGASFGRWNDAAGEAMTIDNPAGFVYRKLLWSDGRIAGAIQTECPVFVTDRRWRKSRGHRRHRQNLAVEIR